MARTVPSISSENPGDLLASALWNTGPKATTDFFMSPPLFAGHETAAFATNTGSAYAMPINSVAIDTDSGHSTNSAVYAAQVAGWYWVVGYATFAATGGQSLTVGEVYNNGAIFLGARQFLLKPGSDLVSVSGSTILHMNAGDTIYAVGTQYTGGTINTFIGTDMAPALYALWIHA